MPSTMRGGWVEGWGGSGLRLNWSEEGQLISLSQVHLRGKRRSQGAA